MFKKLAAIAAAGTAAGMAVVGFAPPASAQIGACANPDVCGFINASGFSILGFANGSFGFISTQPPFLGAGTGQTPTQNVSTAATPRLGQWGLGSLAPRAATTAARPVAPDLNTLLASLPSNVRLAGNAAPASDDGGLDATTVVPVAIGLMGLYGVLMVAVRRRADGSLATN